MKTRKLILIIADLLLLAVCIVQGILFTQDDAKYFKYEGNPDEITIVTPSETINLTLEGENWLLTDKKYPASKSSVESLLTATYSIRALDKIGTLNEKSGEKYELAGGKEVSVEIKSSGNVLRSLLIGKNASSGSQSYITVDGGKDIYLASGNLHNLFNTSVKSLRDRYVWNFDRSSINSLTVTKADGESWSLSRSLSDSQTTWQTSVPDAQVDDSKALSILENTATMPSSSWYADDVKVSDLGGDFVLNAKIGHDSESVNLDIYCIKSKSENEEDKYYAYSSASPYVFELSSYAVARFNKNPEDFIK